MLLTNVDILKHPLQWHFLLSWLYQGGLKHVPNVSANQYISPAGVKLCPEQSSTWTRALHTQTIVHSDPGEFWLSCYLWTTPIALVCCATPESTGMGRLVSVRPCLRPRGRSRLICALSRCFPNLLETAVTVEENSFIYNAITIGRNDKHPLSVFYDIHLSLKQPINSISKKFLPDTWAKRNHLSGENTNQIGMKKSSSLVRWPTRNIR